MNKINKFYEVALDFINKVQETQWDNIVDSSKILANTIKNDGIIYTFGTGHSHCLAEEIFYRAGSVAPIDAILEPSLTGNQDVVKSEQLERLTGFGKIILEHRKVTDKDCIIIISNSGRNAAPIDVAIESKNKGLKTIAITSMSYSKNVTSRHPSGKKLYEVVDIVIDNCGVLGDATVKLEGLKQPMGSTSNLVGIFILHSMLIKSAEILLEEGIEPPVFMSGNLDGSEKYNRQFLDKYWGRIRSW